MTDSVPPAAPAPLQWADRLSDADLTSFWARLPRSGDFDPSWIQVRRALNWLAARGAAPAPLDPNAKRFEEIMAKVREEIRAGRTPEQELRDALTAIRPLIERDDVEDEEWIAAFGKEVPLLVDAAYRFLELGSAHRGAPEPSEALPAIPGTQEYHHCAICERKTPHRFRLVCLDHRSGYDMPLDDLLSAARVFPRQATFEKASDYAARVREWLVDVAAVGGIEPAPEQRAREIVAAAWRDGIAVLVRRLAGEVERAVAVHDDQYVGAIRLTVAELEREL